MGDVDIKNLPRGDLCHGLGVEMFSQTIPHPMKADFFPVYEGFLAWASILTIAIAFLVTRRIAFILLLFVVIISTIISEGIFPNVGDVSLQARPRENCIGKNGFPSGHTQQLTTIWAYLTFDTIFKHGWSAPKKIILLITWLLLFIPNGPSRWAVGDHKWFQIGAGYGIGFAIGLLGWLLVRFVIGRFLEDIMCLGIIRRLRLVNDYDPNYEHSRHKGKKYQETIRKDESKPQNNFITKAWNHFTAPGHSKWQDLKEWQYLLIMLPIPITLFVVGAVGIAASYWKGDLTPDCDISAPEVMLATNALTIFQGGLVCVAIGFGIYRYQASEPDKHVLNQYIWLFICANMIECYIFNYAAYIANDPTEDGNLTKCPPGGDIGSHYVTIWFVVITAMLAYFVIVWFILRLFTLYTNRIEMWPTDRTKKDQPPTQARPPMNGNGNGNGHMNRPDIQEQRTTTSMIGQPGPTGTPLTKRGPFVPQV